MQSRAYFTKGFLLWGKVNISDFGEGGVQCNQELTLQKVFCYS